MVLSVYGAVGFSAGSDVYAAGGKDNIVKSDASSASVAAPKAAAAKPVKLAASASVKNELVIKNVEVHTRGDFQNIYRDTVYAGDPTKGEDSAKWYTTKREFNLKDPRTFNLEFSVPAASVGGDTDAYLNSVTLNYGGVPIGEWGDGNSLRGSTDIFILSNKAIKDNGNETFTVSMSLRSNSPWSGSNAGMNIPFDGYYAGRQDNFNPNGTNTAQSGDNRAWWQAGPTYKGMGMYELAAMVGNSAVAATDIHIGPYDEMYSWIEMNDYAQSLITAVNGKPLSIAELNERPIGAIAKGYIARDGDGKFVKGSRATDVWVEVSILGYGLTDNAKDENKDFNNYSRYNAIWNIVVAYDEGTVDTYLNKTVPEMNDNPQKLIDKYKDAKPEDIDMINVYYQSNVHPDEVTGSDSEIKLINDLIEGKKAGKKIPYKTMEYDDMNLRYRLPTQGYEQNSSTHTVKGTYASGGTFMDSKSRDAATFDTGEALNKLIFVTNITSNPDGRAGMRRMNRYGLDLNRDAVYSTQPETIALTKDITKWDPILMNEWHGYVGQMLIEPCTAPHDPTYEYDLLQNNMLQLAYRAGLAVTGSTAYSDFRIPWDHLSGGDWDDGGTIYGPMYAMLLGAYGYTIEFPHSNTDSFDAGNVINYAMVNGLLSGETKFFEGNALNGELKDLDGKTRDSHKVDNKFTSMRKSSVMSKLEVKLRGVKNIDSMDADKYFIDDRGNGEVIVGRPRPTDAKGNTLPYFPDYIVIPTDAKNQYNVAEGIKGINQMLNLGVKVSVATSDVKYDGKTIPKGAYVFDMKQGNRNLIFEIMSKGYDATNFPSMYADIYCNLPDVRGFDSIQIYGEGLYDGKLKTLDGEVGKNANIEGAVDDYVVFKSQSTDAVRFVNLLLSGKSSGPSTAQKGKVWMLRKDVNGVGNASDYVIEAKNLSKIKKLVDNVDLGLLGCRIDGKYINDLPKEAVQLVDPVIQFNTARTAQTGGVLWWALDDYLGFGSMADYNGTTGNAIRDGANVVVSNNANPGSNIINAVKKDKLGLVLIQNASALTNANFGTGTSAPTTGAFSDIAVNGEYNVDDSLFTANYENTTTMYARGNYYTDNIPAGAKTLFKSLKNGEDAFIGGWQNTNGSKTTFGDRTTMFSAILKGGGITGKPVQALVIGQNMHLRSHYQKLLPMLATGIYAGAAGILDDFNNPEIDIEKSGSEFAITADEPNSGVGESGVEKLAVYQWNKAKGKFTQIADEEDAKFEFGVDAASDREFKVVATDYAGNETVRYFRYTANGGISEYGEDEAILTFDVGGGTAIKPMVFKIGDTAANLPVPTKAGYNFAGWYTDSTFKTPVTKNTKITANMNLVAKWVAIGDIAGVAVDPVKAIVYDGKAKTPTLTVKSGKTVLKLGADYTVAYADNIKIGKATVTITGKGNYKGVKTVSFEIVPKATSVAKLKAGKKSLTVKWKKAAAAQAVTGYQISYKSKKAKSWKTITVSAKKAKNAKYQKVINKLKKGARYQVKIRTYKTVDGVKYHSNWSGIKTSSSLK
jgi:uncharacterized repeat protein (TIGR02543 family)